MTHWVSCWCLGTRGAQFPGLAPSWVIPSAGEQRGPAHIVSGRLGHLSLGLASPGHQKFHMYGQNANAEWMPSWILLAIPSLV